RECRICREEVRPTYEEQGFANLDRARGKPPRKTYYSEEDGYLINPCLCKGSAKWIHENCLQQTRYSGLNPDHMYRCPTCKYEYKLQNLTWARWLRSPILAFVLAVLILAVSIFLLGFVADPILNLWIDPVGAITEGIGIQLDPEEQAIFDELGIKEGWLTHFGKGTMSLGVLGFVKAFLAMTPWQWWNLRASGVVGGPARRGGTGRDRLENMSLALVVIGVATFFWAVWKGTRAWTQRTLDRASEKVMNVQSDDDDDD
ncbi:uncharacterized protein BCR38DRAFT_295975, partial [Pseudomassariella vexata]